MKKFEIIHLGLATTLGLIFWGLSLLLLPFYDGGDQIVYSNFYYNCLAYDLWESFECYRNSLGTSEPGYFLVAYALSSIFGKNEFSAALNGVFTFLVFHRLFKMRVVSYFIILIPLNFYFLVLFFAAERLKVAFIFAFIGFYFLEWRRFILFIFAALSHVQISLMLIVLYIISIIRKNNYGFSFMGAIKYLIAMISLVYIIYMMRDHIAIKFASYNQLGGLIACMKASLFIFISLAYSRNKIEPIIAGAPIVIAAYFVGSDRLVIFSYIFFLGYALSYGRGYSVLIFASAFYFSWKGFDFFHKILTYGNGFYVG